MWLFVFTVLSCICFGFLLDISSVNAESMDADLVKRINLVNATVKTMVSNYHELLKTVLKDGRTIDFLKKQNHYLERKLNSTMEKMEKLMSEKETSSYNIENLQNITSQQQHELNKAKNKSNESRISIEFSLTLLNNKLQELTNSTGIGLKNVNGNVLKENTLLRNELKKFKKRIKQMINKKLDKIDPVCQQPKLKGPCSDFTVKHFFNTNSSKCERFWYGGCKGNQNNFQSDEECQAACVQGGAIDLQKMTKDVIALNTKVTNLESSADMSLSNLTLISSKLEKTFKDVKELKADVDGQWSRWINTPSSVTCGVGCSLRYRECSNPYPQQGGKKCTGSRNKHVKCLQYDPCPVHGTWSVWSETTCSVTCGVGTSLRTRNCSNPHPQYGGNNCTGKSIDHVTCTQPNKCPVNGAWSAWSDNTCSVTCGVGTKSRSRSCSNPHPQYGGNNCIGNDTDHVTCTQLNKCPNLKTDVLKPVVTVNPTELKDTVGQTIVFQCNVQGPGPFNVIWSRIDGQGLPNRAQVGPIYSLTIIDVQETDEGRYVCTATNVHGSSRQYVNLTILGKQHPIRLYIEPPKERSVHQGQSVRFVCMAKGKMQSNYIMSWSKVGGLMPNKAIDQNGVLVIPNVRPEDGGTYECYGYGMFSMDTDRATLRVSAQQVKPTVRIEPTFQTVNEFETAEFRCVTTGRPAPTVEWRRGTGSMNPSAVVSGGLLRIQATLRSDEAQYFCKASNVAGTTEVKTILYVKSDIKVIVRQVAIIAPIGSTEQLICYIDDNSVRPTLIWSRNGGLPPGSAQVNGVLTLKNIQPSFAGSYVCTAITPNGDKETGTTTLTVRPEIETTVPTATVTPDRTTITQGTTGTIRCSVTGTPQPTITWSKSREQLTTRHQVVGEMLRITNSQVEDRGVYICRAENTAGLGQGWAIVEVERRAQPKLDIYPAISQTIKTGESALFQCRVMSGDPPPTVTWSRAGGETIVSTIDTMENGVIMFKGVTGEEAGGYICTATNEMGSVTATATLIIQGPPRIVISPSKKVFAVIGQRVSLECTGEGDPIPRVQWKYERAQDSGDVPKPVEGALSQGSATLTLNAVSRSDSGNYYCTANNVAGSVTETVQLEIQERGQQSRETGVSIRGPKQRTVREGETVTIKCDTTGIQNDVVRWRKRDGLMPNNHAVRGVTLTIPNFQTVYSGEYICSASSSVKKYETSVFINVTARPIILGSQADYVSVGVGLKASMSCETLGYPQPDITWYRKDGQMPSEYTVEKDGSLTIRKVNPDDGGKYVCIASNKLGKIEQPMELLVEDLVPYFPQNPVSYITYPPMKDVYLDFDILLRLKPEAIDGLVLYNGNDDFQRGGGDYVCFGLREGYPEFTFDVGSGPAIIKGNETLDLNQWHTVRLERNRKAGTLTVNDKQKYFGEILADSKVWTLHKTCT
ncbi:heparan sulfate proteoglycan 2 (perlecan) [Mytilus galloprovincialis]|uniref:Heparan sulfate proteoglycan 2 (Perlecan) n=1 Tax=Mytilus galloprovincialis TaxID=29158 RepID=A0A8B6D4K3_MYTGA|nr:heparan sulfate proteoglycan 2 (perlecan) [Mytilus galloprovincialis]